MKKVEIISEKLQDLKKIVSGESTFELKENSGEPVAYEFYYLQAIKLTISGNAEQSGSLQIRLLSDKNDLLAECQFIFYPGEKYHIEIGIQEEKIEFRDLTLILSDDRTDSSELKGRSPLLGNQTSSGGFCWQQIYYATDRKKENDGRFGEQRNYKVQYGSCTVSIPANKERGKLPRPSIWRWDLTERTDRHVILQKIVELNTNDFFNELKIQIGKSSQEDAFLFIHGFNTTFADAALRTAQMAHDLDFEGAPIMYSWTSTSSIASYLTDGENIELAISDIVELIKDVYSKTEVKRFHLIAHSMGTRGLTKALIELQNETQLKFNQVILAAPDIDADIFVKNIAPRIGSCSSRITLYASSNDRALKASKLLRNNHKRAGESGDQIVCTEGVDTIDASRVYNEYFNIFKHDYFAQTNSLIKDIYMLIKHDLPPDKRNLQRRTIENGTYWMF